MRFSCQKGQVNNTEEDRIRIIYLGIYLGITITFTKNKANLATRFLTGNLQHTITKLTSVYII